MRIVIKDRKSSWKEVISTVLLGTVRAPTMFVIYINDMIKGVNSYMSIFANDAKLKKKKLKRS